MSKKWSSKVMLPTKSTYQNRVTKVASSVSENSGNPMIVIDFEVAAPNEVEIDGESYVVAGAVKTKQYFPFRCLNKDGSGVVDNKRTDDARQRLLKAYELFGDPQDPAAIDWDNPPLTPFQNKVVWTRMTCETTEQRDTPTAEQKAANQLGDISTNPVTGESLVAHWPKITEIFGLVAAS